MKYRRQKNVLNDSTRIQSAKPRPCESLWTNNPASSTNKLYGEKDCLISKKQLENLNADWTFDNIKIFLLGFYME